MESTSEAVVAWHPSQMLQGRPYMCMAVDASHASAYVSATLNHNTEYCLCN